MSDKDNDLLTIMTSTDSGVPQPTNEQLMAALVESHKMMTDMMIDIKTDHNEMVNDINHQGEQIDELKKQLTQLREETEGYREKNRIGIIIFVSIIISIILAVFLYIMTNGKVI